MIDWVKKITKAVGDDLEPGEQLQVGVLLQPSGTTMRMAAVQGGGLIGAAIAAKVSKTDTAELRDDVGTAATLPAGQALVVGVTDRRVAVWSHGKLSGKPKDFVTSIPFEAIAGVDIEKRKATYAVTLVFSDGTGRLFESPRMGTDPEALAAALNR